MLKIKVNGEEKALEKEVNVMELLRLLDVEFREVGLAVAINGEVVPKSQYRQTLVKDGDSVEIVQLVGGG